MRQQTTLHPLIDDDLRQARRRADLRRALADARGVLCSAITDLEETEDVLLDVERDALDLLYVTAQLRA